MRQLIIALSIIVIGLALLATPLVATAHRTGDDRRTVDACRTLPTPAARQACIACVQRSRPHHYHANAPAGERCRPNNGLP
jgi:hypothetical protein